MGLVKDAEDTWTARRTNESIISELGEPIRLSVTCGRRILGYFGYVTRKEDVNLQKDILFGKTLVKKRRGRAPTRWTDATHARTGMVVGAASEAEDRDKWNTLVGVVRSLATVT